MRTDTIIVSSRGNQMEAALKEAEKVAAYKGLSAKNALHLRLLTEEMMGMMRSITGENTGEFWIEDKDNEFRLHLTVVTRMDSAKRDQLLAASTSGRNESAKTFMGMIRDFFDRGADEDVASYASPLMMSGMYEYSSSPTLDLEWSMMRYQTALSTNMEGDTKARDAWDELEKSVVAHVADDVKVYIRGREVELVIVKKCE